MELGIVVLNYNKYEETIKCVESILLQKNIDIFTVIVDNGSTNESFEILYKKYNNYKNIYLIHSENNLGYAKGNNLGIDYLRSQNIDYIIIANSDVCFPSENIIEKMYAGYEKGVGLIVPVIKNLDGTTDQRVVYKRKFLYLRILKKILQVNFNFFNKLNSLNDSKKEIGIENNKKLMGLQKDCYVVSGSIFLLTPEFFEKYDRLFPETFLYFEEWATIIYLHKAKIYSKIVDTPHIIHVGGASSYNGKDANKVKLKYVKDSSKKILKLMFLSKKGINYRYNKNEDKKNNY